MLEHDADTTQNAASQVRVPARDLVEALASLEGRKAWQAYEQVGTITLTEAIEQCGVETTPAEMQAEVDRIKAADAAYAQQNRRHRRRRFLLGTEMVSAGLCLLAVVVLQHTVFNPGWRQAAQTEDFQQKLRQSLGPNPKYEIDVVPESSLRDDSSGVVITTFGKWAAFPAYPLHSLPDGCNIHHFDGLDDDGLNPMFPAFGQGGAYVEFRAPQAPFFRDTVSVYYNGLQYWRGAIRKEDISKLRQGHALTLYPALVFTPRYFLNDAVPITVSLDSIQAAQGRTGWASPQDYDIYYFPEGAHVQLDKHAWEDYPKSSSK